MTLSTLRNRLRTRSKGVVSAAIDVAEGAVKLTLYIGGELVTTFDMVIHTVEDAVLAIVAIVKTWIADIEKFIEWLMLLFDWENILQTQRAMRALIEQSIGTLQDKIGLAESSVATVFGSLKDDFKNKAFPSVVNNKIFTAYTFGGLPTNVSSTIGNTALSTGTVRLPLGNSQPVTGSSNVHHNWFIDKVLDALTLSFSTGETPGFDPTSFLESSMCRMRFRRFGLLRRTY